jgi:tRNA-dihydrouridine synthase
LIAHIVDVLRTGELTPAAPSVQDRLSVVKEHMSNYLKCFGEKKASFDMRKHLSWYSRGLSGATTFRSRINSTKSLEELIMVVDQFFGQATLDQYTQSGGETP